MRTIVECYRHSQNNSYVDDQYPDTAFSLAMVALITVILSFILSGIIGNRLIQRWQQRNWRVQHSLEATEKNLEALRIIADEITRFADARIFRSRRVVWQMGRQ